MAESASGQNEASPVFPLDTRARKTGSSYPLGISRVVPTRTSYLFGHMINPSMTKLGRFLALLSTLPLSWSIKRQKRTWLINIQPSWPHARSITHIFTEEWNKSQEVKSGRMVFVIKNGPHSSPVRFITHTYNLQRKLTIGSFGCLWNCTSRTRVSFSGRSPTESSICLLL